MSTFAELSDDGTVLRVIVIEPEVLAKGHWGDPENWIETKEDGSVRGKFAGIGYKYDAKLDEFAPLKSSDDAPLITGNQSISSDWKL